MSMKLQSGIFLNTISLVATSSQECSLYIISIHFSNMFGYCSQKNSQNIFFNTISLLLPVRLLSDLSTAHLQKKGEGRFRSLVPRESPPTVYIMRAINTIQGHSERVRKLKFSWRRALQRVD